MSRKIRTALFALVAVFPAAVLCSACDIELLGFFYSFSTPDERFEQSRALAQPEAILPSGESYSLALFSDPHFSSDFFVDFKGLTASIPRDSYRELAAVAVLGDLSQDGREEDYLSYCVSTEDLRMLNVIGNHDLYNSGWLHYEKYIGASSYALTIGKPSDPNSLLVINLDSANATLGKKQTDWLVHLLENERDSYEYCIIITHSNFFTSSLETRVQFTEKEEIHSLIELFRKFRVDYVFSGHSHQLYRFELFHTSYVCLDAVSEPGSHYIILTVDADGISDKLYPVLNY